MRLRGILRIILGPFSAKVRIIQCRTILRQPAARLQDGAAVVEQLPPGGALIVVVPVPAPLGLGGPNDPGRVGIGMMLSQGIFVVAEVCEVVDVAGGVVFVGHAVVVRVAGLGVAVVASDKGRNLWLISSLE